MHVSGTALCWSMPMRAHAHHDCTVGLTIHLFVVCVVLIILVLVLVQGHAAVHGELHGILSKLGQLGIQVPRGLLSLQQASVQAQAWEPTREVDL